MLRKRSYTNEEFIEAVRTSYSIAEVLRKLNLCKYGSTYRAFKILAKKLNADTTHFTGQLWSKGKTAPQNSKPIYALKDILVENSPYTNNTALKKRLISASILKNECSVCGLNSWQGKPLSVQFDHINGNNTDNRIENLRLLCPNCHSQTITYSGRNKSYKTK